MTRTLPTLAGDERKLAKPWIETPLIESAALSKAAGCRIFLKLENLQPSSSFKSRGIGNLILASIASHPPHTPLHFYSSSGGNAGLACVTAARTLGYPASVVVPLSTSPFMIGLIRSAGATEVLQVGAAWFEADRYLKDEILATRGAGTAEVGVYVPPFDHPDIWSGAATMVAEMKAQLGGEAPEAVVCSVGGGGLLMGILEGLRFEYGDLVRTQVVAAETTGAASLAAALEAEKLVTLREITSIATSLGASTVAAKAFEEARAGRVRSVVLSDRDAALGCLHLADEERMLVEPACGVTVAVCYEGRLRKLVPGLTKESTVVLVVCGGSKVSVELLSEWRAMYGNMAAKA